MRAEIDSRYYRSHVSLILSSSSISTVPSRVTSLVAREAIVTFRCSPQTAWTWPRAKIYQTWRQEAKSCRSSLIWTINNYSSTQETCNKSCSYRSRLNLQPRSWTINHQSWWQQKSGLQFQVMERQSNPHNLHFLHRTITRRVQSQSRSRLKVNYHHNRCNSRHLKRILEIVIII